MSGPGYHQGLRTRAKLIVLKGFGQVIISISPEKKNELAAEVLSWE